MGYKLVKDMTEEERKKKNEINRLYRQSPGGIKNGRIQHWRDRGIVYPDYNDLYIYVYLEMTRCETCKIDFINRHKKYCRVVDHCHYTGEIRGIICKSCNAKLEKQKKLTF